MRPIEGQTSSKNLEAKVLFLTPVFWNSLAQHGEVIQFIAAKSNSLRCLYYMNTHQFIYMQIMFAYFSQL